MPPVDPQPLRGRSRAAGHLYGRDAAVSVLEFRHGTGFGRHIAELSGRSVLVATRSQLAAAIALIELDGLARRLIILPPDTDPNHLPAVIAAAEIDAVVFDTDAPSPTCDLAVRVQCTLPLAADADIPPTHAPSEWVLLTSGTTGMPKMAMHDLCGLSAAI